MLLIGMWISFIAYPRNPRKPIPIPWRFADIENSLFDGFTHFLRNARTDRTYSDRNGRLGFDEFGFGVLAWACDI